MSGNPQPPTLLEFLGRLSLASMEIGKAHASTAQVIGDKALASWIRAKLFRANELLTQAARDVQPKPQPETESLKQWSDDTQGETDGISESKTTASIF